MKASDEAPGGIYVLLLLFFALIAQVAHPIVALFLIVPVVAITLITLWLMRSKPGWWVLFLLFWVGAIARIQHLMLVIESYGNLSLPEPRDGDVNAAIVEMVFFGILLGAMLVARVCAPGRSKNQAVEQ